MPASRRTGSMAEEKRRRRKAKVLPAKEEMVAGPAGEGDPAPNEGAQSCGFIALIGAPNVGKSTLVNALVGSKVAIVSHKVQTTRAALRGIATAGGAQLVFIDTPGIFAPRRRLDRAMVANAWAGAHDADIAAVLIDAKRGLDAEAEALLGKLSEVRQPKILLLNKIDLVEKPALLAIAKAANERIPFAATFMVSALAGDGVADVRSWLAAHVPAGPWHYPEDQITDAPLRQLAAEITRETIYVERESQRKIVLGKGGATIKAIGADARREIAGMVEAPVHLFLFVKVREHWGDDPKRYRGMGLEFPDE